MKKIVLDTNKLFAALLSRNENFRQILFDPGHRIFTAKYLIVEILKHKERIVKASKASEEEIYDYLHEVLSRIEFINEDLISTQNYVKAYWLCKDTERLFKFWLTAKNYPFPDDTSLKNWSRSTTMLPIFCLVSSGNWQFFAQNPKFKQPLTKMTQLL